MADFWFVCLMIVQLFVCPLLDNGRITPCTSSECYVSPQGTPCVVRHHWITKEDKLVAFSHPCSPHFDLSLHYLQLNRRLIPSRPFSQLQQPHPRLIQPPPTPLSFILPMTPRPKGPLQLRGNPPCRRCCYTSTTLLSFLAATRHTTYHFPPIAVSLSSIALDCTNALVYAFYQYENTATTHMTLAGTPRTVRSEVSARRDVYRSPRGMLGFDPPAGKLFFRTHPRAV